MQAPPRCSIHDDFDDDDDQSSCDEFIEKSFYEEPTKVRIQRQYPFFFKVFKDIIAPEDQSEDEIKPDFTISISPQPDEEEIIYEPEPVDDDEVFGFSFDPVNTLDATEFVVGFTYEFPQPLDEYKMSCQARNRERLSQITFQQQGIKYPVEIDRVFVQRYFPPPKPKFQWEYHNDQQSPEHGGARGGGRGGGRGGNRGGGRGRGRNRQ